MSNIIIEVEIIKANKAMDIDFISYYPTINILIYNRIGKPIIIDQLFLSVDNVDNILISSTPISVDNIYRINDFDIMSMASEEMSADDQFIIKAKIRNEINLIESTSFLITII